MKTINIVDILRKELIGKRVRLLTYSNDIFQEYIVWGKKSKNVTNEQFEGGDLKYRKQINRRKKIGQHKIFENLLITDVRLVLAQDYDESDYLFLLLENGSETYFGLDETLTHIYDNVYKF